MDDVRGALAANLAELRKEENQTQAEFAAQFNYSDKAVSKWERGDSLPDVVMLKTIADLYGLRVDDLLSAVGELAEVVRVIFGGEIVLELGLVVGHGAEV